MFLKRTKPLFNKISHRLAFAYICFFIPCYFLTFGLFYYFSSKYLEKRDRDVIEARLQQVEQLLKTSGSEGFGLALEERRTHGQTQGLLIYLASPRAQTLLLHLPEESNKFEYSTVENFLKAKDESKQDFWFNIPSKDGDEDALEVKSVLLPGGERLVVGASTDERDEILDKFKEIFFVILFPLVFISGLGSIFISQRMLWPLRRLSKSISEIKEGHLGSRVPLPRTIDELYDLSKGYNEMAIQVENLVEAIKQTVDNIAHDLKTPITRIHISSEMALQKNTHASLQEAAEESLENCDSMLAMIQAIFEMARLSTKTIELKRTRFDVAKLIAEVTDLYCFVAEDRGVQVLTHCSVQSIEADRLRLKQILANLIDNAIKYSSSGSVVEISVFKKNESTLFSVKDQGIGISPEDQPRVWERLFRADKSRSEPGLGLGLSLVKVFAEAHGGAVEVLSEVGKGSEFIVEIPHWRGDLPV